MPPLDLEQLKASLAEQLSVEQLRTEFRGYVETKVAQELVDFYLDSLDREEVAEFFDRQVPTCKVEKRSKLGLGSASHAWRGAHNSAVVEFVLPHTQVWTNDDPTLRQRMVPTHFVSGAQQSSSKHPQESALTSSR